MDKLPVMNKDEFFALELECPGINPFYCHALVGLHYCQDLHLQGLCVHPVFGECSACHQYVAEAFNFQCRDTKKSPVGLLIWKLRQARAKFTDDAQLHKGLPTSESEDAFGEMLNETSSS